MTNQVENPGASPAAFAALKDAIADVQFGSHIRKSLSKICNFANEPAHIAVIGHSIVNGVGTGSTQAEYDAFNFVVQMRAQLGTILGTAVNEGVLEQNSAYRYTLTGTSFAANPLGFLNAFNLTSTGQSAAITLSGSVAYVYMFANASPVTLSYTVDGGPSLTPTLVSSTLISSIGGTGVSGFFQVISLALGSNSPHNIVLTGPASGAVSVYFIEARASATSGLTVSRMGKNGAVLADDFTIASLSTDPLPTTAANTNGQKTAQTYSLSRLIGADLVALLFDVNDTSVKSSTYGYAYNPTRIKDNIQRVVNGLIANGSDVLLMTGAWIDPTNPAYTAPFTQQSNAALYQDVARLTDGCAYMDLRSPYDSFTDMNNAALFADYVHPNRRGAARFGRAVARALMRAAP
ncbi:hypothetical protein [Caulobacter phage KcrB]|nr:hypothetical protein RW_GP081c [Caulobacter phage RW]WCA46385.1 hypothetical protein [Caulobacter phage KcrB]WCD56320.1 hypothetical protein [Caulobacter phage RLK]WNV48112.1 hypothetical protein GB2A_gp080c [Caulobacter phage GB2A]